jgi:hypothetical protein
VDSDVIENATPGCSRLISKWLNCSLAFRFDWCLVAPQCLCTWHLATGFPNTTHQKSKKNEVRLGATAVFWATIADFWATPFLLLQILGNGPQQNSLSQNEHK